MKFIDKFKKSNNIIIDEERIFQNVETFSNNWNAYSATSASGDIDYLISLDMEIDNLSEETKKQYPHLFQVNVPHLKKTKDRIVGSKKELARLHAIEDGLSCASDDVKYVGKITGENTTAFVFYHNGFEEEDEFEQLIGELMKHVKSNEYTYWRNLNDNFSHYEDCIAPGIYSRQQILNRVQCASMESMGDSLTKPRSITFSFIFNSATHIDKIANDLCEKDFRESRREEAEDGKYQLELILEGYAPDLEDINAITDYIISILEGTDGYFTGWNCPITILDENERRLMNQSQIAQMEKSGESFTTARDIDFFLIFGSNNHIDKTANDLVARSFREVGRGQMEDGKFCLELVLEDIPKEENINRIIDDINDLLKDTDGYFDGWGCTICKA